MCYRWEVKRVGLAGSKHCGFALRVWGGERLRHQAVYSSPDAAAHRGAALCRKLARRSARRLQDDRPDDQCT